MNCGAQNGDDARFCSRCGTRLPTPDDVSQRKTATILFSDLVESTSTAEKVDPEALTEMLAGYFRSMRAIIERHGGTVEKFIGDAVVGMFGVPAAHEDDALRAVRAALEMQLALEGSNDELERRHGIRLAARIGINTGEIAVSVAGSESASHLALGHAINMAARLEQAAGAGEVLIGADTLALVGDAVTTKSVGPLAVKGSSEEIGAWRVLGSASPQPRGWQAGGLFVGRERELGQIESAFGDAVDNRMCVTVTVVAPPGMGKSRLAAEVVELLANRARVLIGRCLPYGEGVTYAALAEIVGQVGVSEAADATDRARHALASTALASPEETAWAFKQLIESLAEHQPVVVVVDDLHWAEPLLLDLLDYVASFSVERPILLLCLARPDLFDTRPEWATPRPNSFVVRLEPLTVSETEWLLSATDDGSLDPTLRRQIVDAAAGVPLFVEQMAAHQSEGEGLVPPTIRALLAARIDRLERAERKALEIASIQGEAFDRSTVAALGPDSMRSSLGTLLLGLVRREFIRPERTAEGPDGFRFSHALVRDAAYEQIPRRRRSELHERYAELVSSNATANSRQEVIGHHLEQAQIERAAIDPTDPEARELGLRAGRALHAAGRAALARKEWQHAIDLLDRAQELLSPEPSAAVAILPDLVEALVGLPDLDEARRVYEAAVSSSRVLHDRSTEMRAEIAWAPTEYHNDRPGWQERVSAVSDAAVEHFTAISDDANLSYALLQKAAAMSLHMTGMIETLQLAQLHAERAGDERALIQVWDELGGAMIAGPTPYDAVLLFMQREVSWARERGIVFTEADGRLGLAYALSAADQIDDARDELNEVRDMFARLPGFVAQLGECDTLGGFLELEAGNPEVGEALYRRAMETFERGGNRRWRRTAAVGLVHALVDLGRVDEADALLVELESQGSTRSIRADSAQYQARARVLAARRDVPGALSVARAAVEMISGIDSPYFEARARELLGDLLDGAGDTAAARAEYTTAHRLYQAKGYLPGVRRVTEELG